MVRVEHMVVRLLYRSVSAAFETWADTVEYEREEARRSADRAALHGDMQRAEQLHQEQLLLPHRRKR